MFFTLLLLLLIIKIISINQFKWPWEERPIEELFEGPSLPLWIIAWVFLAVGLISLTVLIVYTKYGREISIRLSVITIVISSIFLGFAFHFFLLSAGF
jgi:hypothetical protein